MRSVLVVLVLSLAVGAGARAQVLVRVSDLHRATYSELHEALRDGPWAVLWRRMRAALAGRTAWNDAPLSLTGWLGELDGGERGS